MDTKEINFFEINKFSNINIQKTMSKIFNTLWFVIILILSSGAGLNAQKIEFEKTVHDFGTVPSILGPATYNFKFKNVGDKPLAINTVNSSCGCTSPNWTKEPVKPGETGEVSVSYTSVNSATAFNKKVTVRTNGSPSSVVLNIKGVVTHNINTAFPDSVGKLKIKDKRNVFFPQVLSSQTSQIQTVEVANITDKDIDLSFEDVPKYLIVNSDPVVKPKSRSLINIGVDGTKIKKSGYSADEFTVKSGNATGTIKVSYVIAEYIEPYDNQPVCEIENAVIDLGDKPIKENNISESLKIKNTGGSDLIIKSFTTDNANFVPKSKKELKIKSGQTGEIKYSAKNLPEGEVTANIYLNTNAPQTPILVFTIKLKLIK
jgi:hypothetical protein